MVSTAMRCPASTARRPNASMKVDFPTPGDPEIPIRIVPLPGAGRASRSPMAVPGRRDGWTRPG